MKMVTFCKFSTLLDVPTITRPSHVPNKRRRTVHHALLTSRQKPEPLEYRWVGWLDWGTDGLTVSAPFGVELWRADVRCR